MKKTMKKKNEIEKNDKIFEQTFIGDIRGIVVYKCENCKNRIYGFGNFCRKCGVKLKEFAK